MQRRDLSRILLAAPAVSVLGAATVIAQSSTTAASTGYAPTAAENAAGVAPTNMQYLPGDVRRYGADPTGAIDSTGAIQCALNIAQDVYLPAGSYLISSAKVDWMAFRTGT